ncbi:MAG: hypothetical protein IKZ12_07395 [Alistipes sp.]|nr:hypothetical protein [Alistipes sp.]
MADKSVLITLEERVEQLLAAHGRLASLCRELKEECTALRAEKRALEEQNRALRSDLARKELTEGLSGGGRNRDKARARVNRLMREVDKCIALVGGIEDAAARDKMNEAK